LPKFRIPDRPRLRRKVGGWILKEVAVVALLAGMGDLSRVDIATSQFFADGNAEF
jgi:hypothetical protein